MVVMLSLLLLPCHDIIDTGYLPIKVVKVLSSNVKIPKGVPYKHATMLNAQIVNPNVKLVEDILKLGIPQNSAKAIAYALQYGGRVFLTDEKAYKLAKYLKLEAIYINNKE
jgi:hypothetical protein